MSYSSDVTSTDSSSVTFTKLVDQTDAMSEKMSWRGRLVSVWNDIKKWTEVHEEAIITAIYITALIALITASGFFGAMFIPILATEHIMLAVVSIFPLFGPPLCVLFYELYKLTGWQDEQDKRQGKRDVLS